MTKVILASQSPRRQQLLTEMGVAFIAVPSNFEEHLDDERDAKIVALELARGKALDVARRFPDDYVIGSDTIMLTAGGKQLEKPTDNEDARRMLYEHSRGGVNTVITSVVVVCLSQSIELSAVDVAKVHIRSFTSELKQQIDKYVTTGDSLDKAGGYGIQSGADFLVEYIEGDYDTIIGFPTKIVAKLLNEVGIDAKAVDSAVPVKRVSKK